MPLCMCANICCTFKRFCQKNRKGRGLIALPSELSATSHAVVVADVVPVAVAVVEVHVERVIRAVSLARPVVVVGPPGVNMLRFLLWEQPCLPLSRTCACSPPAFGLSTSAPQYRLMRRPVLPLGEYGTHNAGEAPVTLGAAYGSRDRRTLCHAGGLFPPCAQAFLPLSSRQDNSVCKNTLLLPRPFLPA